MSIRLAARVCILGVLSSVSFLASAAYALPHPVTKTPAPAKLSQKSKKIEPRAPIRSAGKGSAKTPDIAKADPRVPVKSAGKGISKTPVKAAVIDTTCPKERDQEEPTGCDKKGKTGCKKGGGKGCDKGGDGGGDTGGTTGGTTGGDTGGQIDRNVGRHGPYVRIDRANDVAAYYRGLGYRAQVVYLGTVDYREYAVDVW